MSPGTGKWRAAMIGAAALGIVLRILLALKAYGTNDAYAYELFAEWSRAFGASVYRYQSWNNPPSTLHLVAVLRWLGNATGLGFSSCLRLADSVADLGSLWLVCQMLRARLSQTSVALVLVFLSLSPVCILISGFHGNTDSLMTFFLILAIFAAQELDAPWAAGVALAWAVAFKVAPLILLPVFVLYFGTTKKRATFLAVFGASLLALWSPYIFEETDVILHSVFGYKSLTGLWGFSWLLSQAVQFIPEYATMARQYQQYGTWAIFTAIAGISLWLSRSRARRDLYLQAAVVLLVFLTFTNGFSVQYLAWLAPFVILAGAEVACVFFLTGGLFLFAVYNYWAEGLPWYLADSNRVGAWQGLPEMLQALCWTSVVSALWMVWMRVKRPSFVPCAALRALFCLPALIALSLSLSSWSATLMRDHWTGSDENSLNGIRARNFVDLSVALSAAARYADAIGACHEALKLRPNTASAYNNMAAAEAGLRHWDAAIRDATQAVRLDPNLAAARINLAALLRRKNQQ